MNRHLAQRRYERVRRSSIGKLGLLVRFFFFHWFLLSRPGREAGGISRHYRMKQADPFYKSARWERKRAKILRRDSYMCQISKRYGKLVQANTVHHIFPREDYPEYEWCDWNLISVSNEVHNRLHDRISGELTEEGTALMIRTARKQGVRT